MDYRTVAETRSSPFEKQLTIIALKAVEKQSGIGCELK
jgi:hypothetical protein